MHVTELVNATRGPKNEAHSFTSARTLIPDNVRSVLEVVGICAHQMFATTFIADDLAFCHDNTSMGECIIVDELLWEGKNMLGHDRWWFDTSNFNRMIANDRACDIVAVLDAMNDLDVSAYSCVNEACKDVVDSVKWNSFLQWRTELYRNCTWGAIQ